MIKGVTNWNDRNRFWVQTKNGVEAILKVALPKGTDGIPHGWLETCGPTSCVNVLDAMGKPIDCKSPGGGTLRPSDFLALWMNEPQNFAAMAKAVPSITDVDQYMENEIAAFYPEAVRQVFGVTGEYTEGKGFDWLASQVQSGRGAMICLKNPGHFLAVLAYDDATQEFIYNDSWPNRTKTDGWNLRLTKSEFQTNVKPYALVFS